MSSSESELALLRARIAAIESAAAEEAAARAQAEKKASAMGRLQKILQEKREAVERNRYSKSIPLARFYDQEKIDLMDALLDIISVLNERVTQLELEKSTH